MSTDPGEGARLGARLAEAERLGRRLAPALLARDGLVPSTLGEAMHAQKTFVALTHRPVRGWKVAIGSGGTPIAGAMVDCWGEADYVGPERRLHASAFEIEICFRLAADVVPRPDSGWTRGELLRMIASVHLGAELIGSRLEEAGKAPLPLFLADRLGNHSFVVGAQMDASLPDRLAAGGGAMLTVHDGDTPLFFGEARHPQIDPLLPLLAYLNEAHASTEGFLHGQLVTTGSLCGVLPLHSTSRIQACLQGFGMVNRTVRF